MKLLRIFGWLVVQCSTHLWWLLYITSNITSVLPQNQFPFLSRKATTYENEAGWKIENVFFFWKNWQKCIYYYFSDFVREERCWCADCQWRYAAAGLSPNLMLWLWADVFREIDWNRGKDSVQDRAELFRENNAVILASIVYHVLFISQFQWKKFAILFVRNKIEILTQNSFLRHSIHVYFLHHRRMHHGQNSPASLIDP